MTLKEVKYPYTNEDMMLIVTEYKEAQQANEKINWRRVRLAHEAAENFNLEEFAKQVGENYSYLKNLSSLAGRYSDEDVSKCALTLKLEHFIVAAKSDKRLEWLKKAGDNAWTAARLRREMNPPKPVAKKEPPPVAQPEPKLAVVPAPQTKKLASRTLEDLVTVLNWYRVNDMRSLELAASNALIFVSLLFADDDNRSIVVNPNTGGYEISAPD